MTEDVLHDIPMEYRERYTDLLEEAAGGDVDLSRLRKDVTLYLQTVKQVGLMVKLLDMGMAEKLAHAALGLIDHADAAGLSDEARRHVRAAVRYFILEEEDEEITGVLGFDDDVQVMNAVSRVVGREDLVILLPRTEGD